MTLNPMYLSFTSPYKIPVVTQNSLDWLSRLFGPTMVGLGVGIHNVQFRKREVKFPLKEYEPLLRQAKAVFFQRDFVILKG